MRLVLTIPKPFVLEAAIHKKEFRIVVQCTTYQVASRCCQQVRCSAAATFTPASENSLNLWTAL